MILIVLVIEGLHVSLVPVLYFFAHFYPLILEGKAQ